MPEGCATKACHKGMPPKRHPDFGMIKEGGLPELWCVQPGVCWNFALIGGKTGCTVTLGCFRKVGKPGLWTEQGGFHNFHVYSKRYAEIWR